ncbi:MAG: chromosomal replication initiator protein DnaA [Actinomycetota bacterium]|nr:chromosomal replication initiator protein DnaA [Actinomycetota bacterium]
MTPGLPPQLIDDWARIRSELRRAVSESTFELWLASVAPRALVGDTLVLSAPDEIRRWVADRFGRVLQSCAATVLGPQTLVDVVAPDVALADPAGVPAPRADPDAAEPFNPKLTFDQFVIGDSNRFAHGAALAVAELPGHAYNPLFLYGPPGVGKTHLLHSIGAYVRAHGAGLTVRYTTVERFTNEFVAALRAGGIDAFKARFRRNDVLLIDDVQFLQSKARTEEEFFHTFNALYDAGGQLVLSSDRLPDDLGALEDRLRERFAAGLVADIGPPDLGTRMTILRKRVQHDAIPLPDESALEVLARRITVNARALEGALIRVVALHSLTGRPLDGVLAEHALSDLYPEAGARRPAPTIERIQELTCEAFGVTADELVSSARTAALAWARQVAMYLARRHTDATLPDIGQRFGGRNHTTVLHACKRAEQRIAGDPEDAAAVRKLERRMTGPGHDRLS